MPYSDPQKYKAWIARNKAKNRAYKKRWRDANKVKMAKCRKDWANRNPHAVLATTRRYQTAKLNACPPWANHFFIDEIYDLRVRREAMLGIKLDVDHIVPLQGVTVCGLHVECNLQIVPRTDNRRKHNRSWPDMP